MARVLAVVTLLFCVLPVVTLLFSDGTAAVPFTVTDDSFSDGGGAVLLKVLKNTVTGEEVSVATNYGGGVESLVLRSPSKGATRSVLWTHNRNATAVKLNADWRGRMLVPYGNRIGGAKYTFNGTEYHLPINDVMPCDPPLVCVNNSLHGLLWNRSMQVITTHAGATNASVTLRYDFPGDDPGYPFRLRTDITYTLSMLDPSSNTSRFTVSVAFSNLDEGGWPLPVYNGWHPYFLCHTSKAFITLDPCTPWAHVDVGTGPQYPPPRYSNMVPTTHVTPSDRFDGRLPVGGNESVPEYHDDEFKAMRPQDCTEGLFRTKLFDPVTHDTTILHHQSPYLQVWTGGLTTFGVDAVVLEPLSAMSDAFNNHEGLHILSSGEEYTNVMAITLQ
eukprot:Hpha_TRINITY_DN2903_c0_g1::TRINITY_DN2903_c0_g1_i1::g.19720::m.19720/K01785/galM, GALM; aldose 1-epimerase